jgi:hypothetical protein
MVDLQKGMPGIDDRHPTNVRMKRGFDMHRPFRKRLILACVRSRVKYFVASIQGGSEDPLDEGRRIGVS